MKCPVCGAAELIHDTRDQPYTYKGETTTMPAVTAGFCPACDESITDMAETERVMREMRAFNKRVNAVIVDPGFIVRVRKKLDLGQREAAELFGGGVNAFSRDENGKSQPFWRISCSTCSVRVVRFDLAQRLLQILVHA